MTKREETIEQLTKGMSPWDKQILVDFWSGKGSISGKQYAKYQSILAEFDRIMKTDNKLEAFLEETRNQYKTPWRSEPGQQLTRGEIKAPWRSRSLGE